MSKVSHKYAVISDLHSNVEALTNVLAAPIGRWRGSTTWPEKMIS